MRPDFLKLVIYQNKNHELFNAPVAEQFLDTLLGVFLCFNCNTEASGSV